MAGEQTEINERTLVGKILPGVLTATILAIAAAAVSLYLDSNDHLKRITDNETDILIAARKLDAIQQQKESIKMQDLETKIRLDNLWEQFLAEKSRCTDTAAELAILKKEVNRLAWELDHDTDYSN